MPRRRTVLGKYSQSRAEQSCIKRMNLPLDTLKLVQLDRDEVPPVAPIRAKKRLLAMAGDGGSPAPGVEYHVLTLFPTRQSRRVASLRYGVQKPLTCGFDQDERAAVPGRPHQPGCFRA